ncbi:ComEC/Rec2 family competence protein [Gemmiger sp.]
MTSKNLRRLAAGIAATLLAAAAFVIQFAGGKGSIPTWQQLRAALGVPLQTEESAPQSADGSTAVYVLDVGQGDAVLIEQDGSYCLIDTGPAEAEDALLYDLDLLDVDTLDYLILTHPHADHTGNACAVLQTVAVKQVLLPLWQPDADETADWPRRLAEIAADGGAEIVTVEAGEQYSLGGGTLDILQGGSGDADSVNNASLCTLFTAGTFRFLDTGDAEEGAEQRLVDTYGSALHATLFKAGHHGSYTSNSLAFLQVVRPEAVAVSCGLNNDYGHPHRAALQNFADVGADISRTDREGSLTFTWQNDTLSVETAADSSNAAA